MTEISLTERIVRLEQRMDNLCRELNEDKAEVKDELKAINDNVRLMAEAQTRYKGFIGGVVFTVGALFSVITYFFSNKFT